VEKQLSCSRIFLSQQSYSNIQHTRIIQGEALYKVGKERRNIGYSKKGKKKREKTEEVYGDWGDEQGFSSKKEPLGHFGMSLEKELLTKRERGDNLENETGRRSHPNRHIGGEEWGFRYWTVILGGC